jgi:hypothetical protein
LRTFLAKHHMNPMELLVMVAAGRVVAPTLVLADSSNRPVERARKSS